MHIISTVVENSCLNYDLDFLGYSNSVYILLKKYYNKFLSLIVNPLEAGLTCT